MMNESWYQEAIKERAMPVLTPLKGILTSEKEKWVVSITQEVVDQTGQNLGVVRLDIGYDSLQAYLDHLQLGKQGFGFIINQKHEFVYHPKKSGLFLPAKKCRHAALYCCERWLWQRRGEFLSIRFRFQIVIGP